MSEGITHTSIIKILQKGRAVNSRALHLALAKIQDIFKNYSGQQNGVLSGYGVRR